MTEELVTLFRPVGLAELELIKGSGFTAFPPRLPDQPIFYPVLTFEYAEQIARDWNTKDRRSGYRGFVTRFGVKPAFLGRYDVKQVGSALHQEYWIPAEDLPESNANLVGLIEVVAEYSG